MHRSRCGGRRRRCRCRQPKHALAPLRHVGCCSAHCSRACRRRHRKRRRELRSRRARWSTCLSGISRGSPVIARRVSTRCIIYRRGEIEHPPVPLGRVLCCCSGRGSSRSSSNSPSSRDSNAGRHGGGGSSSCSSSLGRRSSAACLPSARGCSRVLEPLHPLVWAAARAATEGGVGAAPDAGLRERRQRR